MISQLRYYIRKIRKPSSRKLYQR